MNIEHCEFPDDLYYDVENNVWFREFSKDGAAGQMGVSSVFIFLSGKISQFKFRPVSGKVLCGQSLGTIESVKYVGAVRSPVTGEIAALNELIARDPVSLWKSPYETWIANYKSFESKGLENLLKGNQAQEAIRRRIAELRIHCYKLLADEEMYSIGTECQTTLANLSEMLENKPKGYVVLMLTDDPTADIETVRWSMQTGNEIVEVRKEGNLYHFLVRKT